MLPSNLHPRDEHGLYTMAPNCAGRPGARSQESFESSRTTKGFLDFPVLQSVRTIRPRKGRNSVAAGQSDRDPGDAVVVGAGVGDEDRGARYRKLAEEARDDAPVEGADHFGVIGSGLPKRAV